MAFKTPIKSEKDHDSIESPQPCNNDYYLFLLKHKNYEKFEQLTISHLSRLLELDGIKLNLLREEFKQSFKPDGDSNAILLDDDVINRIRQLTLHLADNLEIEGLFRKPGNHLRQHQLMQALDDDLEVNFEDGGYTPHDSVGVIKMYLSRLVEPLLIPCKYLEFHHQIAKMNIIDDEGKTKVNKSKRIETLQLLLLLLPNVYRQLLRGLLDLLYQTCKRQAVNKMSAANLAVVITPQLIWPRKINPIELQSDALLFNDHIAFMIRHSQRIFSCPSYIRTVTKAHYCLQTPPSTLVAPSSAIKRTVSRYQRVSLNETKISLNKLLEKVNSFPDSEEKNKILRNFEKHAKVVEKMEKKEKESENEPNYCTCLGL